MHLIKVLCFALLGNESLSAINHVTQEQDILEAEGNFQNDKYSTESLELLHELLDEIKEQPGRNFADVKAKAKSAKSPLIGLDFSDAQVAKAINMQNILRRKVAIKFRIPNMKELRLEQDLADTQRKFVKLPGAISWLYADSPFPPPFWQAHRLNFEYMSDNATFRLLAAEHADLLSTIDQSNLLNMHDTSTLLKGRTNEQKLRGALSILALRYVVQYDCFVLTNCNTTEYDGFKDCFLPKQACSRGNGWQYMVSAIYPHNEAGTFVFMPQKGRFAPADNAAQNGPKGYSFLFTHVMPKKDPSGNDTWPPVTGSPFTKFGDPGSQCPESHPYDNNGLCSSNQVNSKHSVGRGLRLNA